tara:strand:+ start:337 stop:2550 length:2214 start_codon:yes stop_codon:yes gene_type:complete
MSALPKAAVALGKRVLDKVEYYADPQPATKLGDEKISKADWDFAKSRGAAMAVAGGGGLYGYANLEEDPFDEIERSENAELMQSLNTLDPMDFADTDTVIDDNGEEVTYGLIGRDTDDEVAIRLNTVEPPQQGDGAPPDLGDSLSELDYQESPSVLDQVTTHLFDFAKQLAVGGPVRMAKTINQAIPIPTITLDEPITLSDGRVLTELNDMADVMAYGGHITGMDARAPVPETLSGEIGQAFGQTIPAMIPLISALKNLGHGSIVSGMVGGWLADVATTGQAEAEAMVEGLSALPEEWQGEWVQAVDAFLHAAPADSNEAEIRARLISGLPGVLIGPAVELLLPIAKQAGKLVVAAKDAGLTKEMGDVLKAFMADKSGSVKLPTSVKWRETGKPGQEDLDLRITMKGTSGKNKNQVGPRDIGQYWDDDYIARYGKQGDPANQVDFDRAVGNSIDEVKYQLKEVESGKGWYDQDISDTWDITEQVLPQFRIGTKQPAVINGEVVDAEDLRLITTAIAAPLSFGQRPNKNFHNALTVADIWLKTGRIPDTNPATGKGWTQRPVVSESLRLIQHLVDTHGVKGTADILTGAHTVADLRAIKRGAGIWKDTQAMSIPGKADDVKLGFMLMGKKGGAFVKNLNGIEDTTADLWFTRTWNRHLGRMVSPNLPKDSLIKDQPVGAERPRMLEWNRAIAEELGETEQDTQAILWYYEQQLFHAMGQKSAKPSKFSDGAAAFRDDR